MSGRGSRGKVHGEPMKIYTRTGDTGTTGVFGGDRVDKDSTRVDACGDVDELNAALGVARAALGSLRTGAWIEQIQAELFTLGAELSCAPGKEGRLGIPLLGAVAATRLEQHIDELEAELTPLTNFILPGGTSAGAHLHLARTICRRAERRVLGARRLAPVRDELVVYLNRLSDFLFVLARHANKEALVAETAWSPRDPPEP